MHQQVFRISSIISDYLGSDEGNTECNQVVQLAVSALAGDTK